MSPCDDFFGALFVEEPIACLGEVRGAVFLQNGKSNPGAKGTRNNVSKFRRTSQSKLCSVSARGMAITQADVLGGLCVKMRSC